MATVTPLPATPLAVALLATACSAAGPVQPPRAAFGQPFALRAGASALVGEEGWQVGFDGVASDSRCPQGAQCIVAGKAVVRLWLSRGSGPRQRLELETSGGSGGFGATGQGATVLGRELRLTRLAPYPVVDQPLAASAYVVTLVLSLPGEGANER